MDIGTLVARAGRRFGDRVAVEGPDATRTFAELAERVCRIANGLAAQGLQPGDRVLDLQTNSTAYLETDLAIRAGGFIRAALNHRLHPTDWVRIARDCMARGLVVDAAHVDLAGEVAGLVDVVVVVGGDDERLTLERLIATSPATPLPARDPDALCGLHYSSGTTGHPKGAERTHRNWLACTTNMTQDVLGGPPDPDRHCYVHAGPITHTSGLFVLAFLVAGARQIILPTFDPESFIDAVQRRGATHCAMVPTMIARLLSVPGISRDTLRGLEMLGYAGAPMPPAQMRQAFERLTPHLVQYYGLVEAIPPVTVLDAELHARGLGAQGRAAEPELLTSAGRPALGVEVAVVDESGALVTTGEPGEVITRGDHVMAGYWNAAARADLGKAVREGWLHTGDLGRLDAEGNLWLVDRKGDLIISGGYNIYPREVEEVVASAPGVAEVAVVGVRDAEWGQRVVALVTALPGSVVDPELVIEHCRERLAAYKKPKEVRVIEHFPLNSTGKIAKKELRAQLDAEVPDARG